MAAAAEQQDPSQEQENLFTSISPSSPTTTRYSTNNEKKKKLVLIAVAAVAIVAAIVIPVTISTQLVNGNKEDRAVTATSSSSADPFAAKNGNADDGDDDASLPPTAATNLSMTTTLSPSAATVKPTTPTPNNNDSTPEAVLETASPTTVAPKTIAPTTTDDSASNPTTATATATPVWTPPTEPVLGDAAGTPYLHCPANPNLSQQQQQHIVLLHGAAFSKEIWVQTGILQQFCQEPSVSVTALDMSFASYTQLQTVLDTLAATTPTASNVQVVSLPVVLVTPSAGGSAVVDWMMQGDNVNMLRDYYLSVWIPVAVGSLASATDEQIQSIAPLPVLAIYGDGDVSGGRISQRLARVLGNDDVTVVELVGGHPVYRDSPDEFVATILEYLGVVDG